MYRSNGLHGEPIAVSGMIVVPAGVAPAAGWPIVAWAHPTTGIVDRCAPSQARVRFQMIAGLRDMIDRGYIVVATDYPGLGTPGPHPYLVGNSEARAVLDSVRAARRLTGTTSPRFVVWGHSQGGQAALFVGLTARIYAPELQLLGVAAAAPATDLRALLEADLGTAGGTNLTAMTLWSWSRIYDAPIAKVVDPAAMPVVDRLAQECIESLFDIVERRATTRPLLRDFLTDTTFADQVPWASLLQANTPGPLPPGIPVYLAQGDADQLVLPRVTQAYARRLCAAGSRVVYDVLPREGHGFVAAKAAHAAVGWMDARFAGEAAPSSCSGL